MLSELLVSSGVDLDSEEETLMLDTGTVSRLEILSLTQYVIQMHLHTRSFYQGDLLGVQGI